MLSIIPTITKGQWIVTLIIAAIFYGFVGWSVYTNPQTWKTDKEGKIQERLNET